MKRGSVVLLLTSTSWLLASICVATNVAADPHTYRAAGPASTEAGRNVWLENCETCHGYGIAGAPIPMRPKDWQSRVEKPREVLYSNALLGFYGEDDAWMPARGGNAELSDEQVRAAVDYMAELALYYLTQDTPTEEKQP